MLVRDGEYAELILEGDNEIGPFCGMPSLNLGGDELLTVGELESASDDYFAALMRTAVGWPAARSRWAALTP